MLDNVFVFLNDYGLYLICLLGIVKLAWLIWYKPHRPSYAFRNFFTFYDRYAIRDEKQDRWSKFKSINNPLTILFYIICVAFILDQILLKLLIKK